MRYCSPDLGGAIQRANLAMDERAIKSEETEFMAWAKVEKWDGTGETVGGIVVMRFGTLAALMAMGGHFDVDVSLPTNGSYTFQVGSTLADGKKQQ